MTAGATIGDVDGDGVLDVVLPTTAGSVWALRGDTGAPLPHFPVRAGARTMAPVLLVNLQNQTHTATRPGLHLVFGSFDGYGELLHCFGRGVVAGRDTRSYHRGRARGG